MARKTARKKDRTLEYVGVGIALAALWYLQRQAAEEQRRRLDLAAAALR